MNSNKLLYEKMKLIFSETSSHKELIYNYDDIENLDLFKIFYKATEYDSIHRIMGYNMYMLNSTFEGDDAILMVFKIPILKETGNKAIADHAMEIVSNIEECFTTIDYLKSIEKKEEKCIYIIAFKRKNEALVAA